MLSMTYNGYDLSDLLIIQFIEGRGPFNQEINRQSSSGRDGSYRMSRRIPERLLRVHATIMTDSFKDIRDQVDELNGILLSRNAVPIIFKDEPDITYYGEYLGDNEWAERNFVGSGVLPFVCYDPYKYYSEKTSTGDITLGLGMSALPIIRVTFNDNVNEFTIRHNQTRKHLRIKRNFITGDVLELNALTRHVQVNGQTNMNILMPDSDWFELISGLNSFNISGDVDMEITYRERRL